MITKALQKRIDDTNARLDEAIVAETGVQLDELFGARADDERWIAADKASLLYIVSKGDADKIIAELDNIDRKWAAWATNHAWPRFDYPLQDRLDKMLVTVDAAKLVDLDEDDDLKIAAARARLVAAIDTEDSAKALAAVEQIEKDHAAWATSGAWPTLTIKPSKPARAPSTEDKIDAARLEGEALAEYEVARNWKIAKWGFGLAIGIFIWKSRGRR